MTTKEDLRALRRLELEQAALGRRIEALRQEAALLETQDVPPESLSAHAQTRLLAQLCELQGRYAAQLATLADKRQAATRRILRLERSEWRTLLLLYYYEGRSWAQVAAMLHYSRRQLLRLHNDAIAALDAAG